MIRAEVTIFGNKSEYCHYLENRAKEIVSILLQNNVDVTRITFQEEEIKNNSKYELWPYS